MTLAERIEKFNNLMGDIVPPEVKKDLLDKGFFTAPASTKYHGNYEGGLFDHSYMATSRSSPRIAVLTGRTHAHLCWLVCSTTCVRWTTTSTRSLPKLSAARKSETIPSGNMLRTLCSRVTVISRLWCWHSISNSPRRKSCVFAITWELSATSPSGTIIREQCINIQMFCGHTKQICSLPM